MIAINDFLERAIVARSVFQRYTSVYWRPPEIEDGRVVSATQPLQKRDVTGLPSYDRSNQGRHEH